MEGSITSGMPQILEVSAATHMLVANIGDRNITRHANAEKGLYKIKERVIYLFIYLFLINACNLKVMAR
jgi:hypothetical protein